MEYAFHIAVTSKQNTISISHLSTIDSHQHHWVKIIMKIIIHSFTIPSHLNHSSKQNDIKNILYLSTIDSHQHHWVKIMMKQIIHSYTIPSHLNHSSLFILHRLTPPSLSKNYSEENYSFIYNSLTPHSLIQTKWYQKQYLSSLDSHHHHSKNYNEKNYLFLYNSLTPQPLIQTKWKHSLFIYHRLTWPSLGKIIRRKIIIYLLFTHTTITHPNKMISKTFFSYPS